jgi:hypothetical protein
MKKIMISIGIIVFLSIQQNVIAQTSITEGVVIYDLQMDVTEVMTLSTAMLPTEMTVKFKGTKNRTEFETGASKTVAINDSKDSKSGVVLLDIMNNKYAMKIDEYKINQQVANMPDYEPIETEETKLIAGYKCKKVILVDKNTKNEVTIFYTKEIPFIANSINAEFKIIEGFPMEYFTTIYNVKMTVTVKEIKKIKVSDEEFIVPSGYKSTTQDELMKELSGSMGE